MTKDPISNSEDMIDVRDVIARFEALEVDYDMASDVVSEVGDNEKETAEEALNDWLASEDGEEFKSLRALLEELQGNGGDEQWKGDWYPLQLIRDSYFEDYAQELAEDIGAIKAGDKWPHNCIDWEKAARELQYDYSSVEFDGVTYWYR